MIQATLNVLLATLVLTSCQNGKTEKFEPKVWIGAPDHGAIVRRDEMIDCKAPTFGGYYCISAADMYYLYSECLDERKPTE